MPSPVPEICSCTALRQAARHVTRFYDEAVAPAGLGINQYAILARLERFGPQSLQQLADLLVMDRSSLGHLLRPLQDRRLLELRISPDDRRQRIISLTETGSALVQEARPLWVKANERFEHVFGTDEASNLRKILKRVTLTEFGRA